MGLRELAEDKAIACAYCGGAEIESVPVIVDDDMALSFHRALTDSSAGDSDIEDIKSGLRAALANAYTHPQPAQVNQQLLEALKGLRAVISETRGEPAREAVQIADAAIAAAQEGK